MLVWHEWDNDRRYLVAEDNGSGYILPRDQREEDRAKLLDSMYRTVWDENRWLSRNIVQNKFSPKRILDLGCGSGSWCSHMASKHPDTEVLGIDLSPEWTHE